MEKNSSERLFATAKKFFPGGVNSPVRNFAAVGSEPLFITRAQGSRVWDADHRSYIDYVGSWGPAIVGHAHPEVVQAVCKAAESGLSFGAPTQLENQLAEAMQEAVPALEKLRFVSSGTEACMSAIRVARGFTARDKILKFEGNYHGHADMLLVKAGSGIATFNIPGSAGVPQKVVDDTLLAPYNDLQAVAKLFKQYKGEIAAVIVEAIAGNVGFIPPEEGFLEGLSEITCADGALLIMDEVMTGFRVAYGGVQTQHKLKPDLTTFGKVVGGGMPLAVYGGRADVMAIVAPDGPVYQAGTLSGNPLATTAGLKTLEILRRPGSYETLGARSKQLILGLEDLARNCGIPLRGGFAGGMFGFYFTDRAVKNYAEAQTSQIGLFRTFFSAMLQRGIYLAPSAFEAGFVSLAHSEKDIAETLLAAKQVFTILNSETAV